MLIKLAVCRRRRKILDTIIAAAGVPRGRLLRRLRPLRRLRLLETHHPPLLHLLDQLQPPDFVSASARASPGPDSMSTPPPRRVRALNPPLHPHAPDPAPLTAEPLVLVALHLPDGPFCRRDPDAAVRRVRLFWGIWAEGVRAKVVEVAFVLDLRVLEWGEVSDLLANAQDISAP